MQDYGKARDWFEKVAAKDNSNAMTNLGVLYENGWGVAKDYGTAREWYEKAAAKDNSDARHFGKTERTFSAALASGRSKWGCGQMLPRYARRVRGI